MSESVDDLVLHLPSYMPDDPESGMYRFLDAVGEAIDRLDEDLATVDRAQNVQTADTTAQIEQQARLVNLRPREGESREKFRARVLAAYQLNTCQGTVDDVLKFAARVLNTDIENLQYRNLAEPSVAELTVPGEALDRLNLSAADLNEVLNSAMPVSYRIEILEQGTLEYIDGAERQSGAYDSTKGYDGIDTDDEPTGEGGTYAGSL